MKADLPLFTSSTGVFLTFVVALACFHLAFCTVYKLEKFGWLIVDYVWLATASVALIAASADSRKIVAQAWGGNELASARAGFDLLREQITRYASEDYACRKFGSGELLATEKRAQIIAEHERHCRWYAGAERNLPKSFSDFTVEQGQELLRSMPQTSEVALSNYAETTRWLAEEVIDRLKKTQSFAKLSSRNSWELNLQVFAPLLLAVALALRMTKVTGEILIDQKKLNMSQR
jgi:hypothetical protein